MRSGDFSSVLTQKNALNVFPAKTSCFRQPNLFLRQDAQMPAQKPLEIDPKLLELLVCPLTKGNLTYDRERNELVSRLARLAYPVRDGIPILLPSEARVIEE